MLHPARRLWSAATGSGRLAAMEQDVLGCTREDDVPGFEIPERYFHFVRSGDARPLAGVLEHNRLDLLSLAMLTARAAQLLGEGAPATRNAREALGLGRLYERAGMVGDARRCFERATILDNADAETAANALRALALSCRRSRQYESAAAAWRRVLEIPGLDSRIAQEAAEALAIHHEHRVRDLHAARSFASLSLQHRTSVGRVTALQYRLARLNRKLSPIPLF
jgi:tetratricopeptide (TPR) repeat protein